MDMRCIDVEKKQLRGGCEIDSVFPFSWGCAVGLAYDLRLGVLFGSRSVG